MYDELIANILPIAKATSKKVKGFETKSDDEETKAGKEKEVKEVVGTNEVKEVKKQEVETGVKTEKYPWEN